MKLVAYLLMRTDLPSMNPGKAMAQAFHAGNQIVEYYKTISPKGERITDYFSDGRMHGADNFNTCITLGVTLQQLEYAYANAQALHATVSSLVVDPSYPFLVDREVAALIPLTTARVEVECDNEKVLMTRREVTCAWFIGDKDDPTFTGLFADLSLHP